MKVFERLVSALTDHSRLAIVAMLILTVIAGAGAPMVEQTSELDEFSSETEEGDKLDYIEANFTAQENVTLAQVVVRGDNVLSREAMLETIRFQRALRANETVNRTLAANETMIGVANIVAMGSMQAAELRQQAAELEARNRSLQQDQRALKQRSDELNETAALLEAGLDRIRQDDNATAREQFDQVKRNTSVELTESHFVTYERAAKALRNATTEEEVEAAYQQGTQGVLSQEFFEVGQEADRLESEGAALSEDAAELKAAQQSPLPAERPSLAEQEDQLESLNDSQVESFVERVFSEGVDDDLLSLLPRDYELGTAQANATMMIVRHEAQIENTGGPAAGQETIDAQVEMRQIGMDRSNGLEYMVFGAGVVSHEIDSSMADSLIIVAPLALAFVLVALVIAYRDLLDILLGTLGIGVVLAWTFGFMGWADINFNQLFIAIPVLLIGLSIDYAIHIFMRHREARMGRHNGDTAADGGHPEDGSRQSMRVAMAGVGLALVWVTATTVIGFVSNVTSPVPPIREFGITAAVGIVAALLVFGILVPALKIELDELFERYGFDRKRRAFGTGGGRFSQVLSVGAIAARRAPIALLVFVLLVSAAGAYGGTQVDTSFNQQDFLADDPPNWMKDLPEPFTPGTYTVKSSLSFVNDRFVREDSQAEFLIEGNVTAPDTLERVDGAERQAANSSVTQELASDEAAVRGPMTAIEAAAQQNETFNQTVTQADTDGDGIPDRNLEQVYDELFAVAPAEAAEYVHRTEDGEYVALRVVVSTRGGLAGQTVTDEMQAIATDLDGDGLEVTATGQAVLNAIVQDQLLDTVIESLVITLVAVFLFLMIAYRITDGTATLGAVTLLPVAFAVAWIVGSMYLLSIPFNVLTGMITSLTIGLGVAYSIHLSERYTLELERQDSVWTAMRTAVTGTGGALVGSAATTVGGFGVLVFSILPPLRQFGIITGLTIVYALLGSVLVLPSLLALWTRYFGPEWAKAELRSGDAATAGAEPESGGAGGEE